LLQDTAMHMASDFRGSGLCTQTAGRSPRKGWRTAPAPKVRSLPGSPAPLAHYLNDNFTSLPLIQTGFLDAVCTKASV
jgi:hypothetical protein